MEKKEVQIIRLLISATTYMSSYAIADNTGISRRLIRDEMNNVKKILKSLGFNLISKPSKGYRIEAIGSKTVQYLSLLIDQKECERHNFIPTLPTERVDYIVKRLLEANSYVKIDDISNELLISRSSISKDLKSVKKTLSRHNLSIKQKPNYGITIVGKEINCRKSLCDYLFTNFKNSAIFYDLLRSFGEETELIENGIIIILDKFNIEMSDISLCDFLLWLSVSVSRMQSGHYLDSVLDISDIKDDIVFDVAKHITDFLQLELGISIPELETIQVGIELISKRSATSNTLINNQKAKKIVTQIIEEIYQRTLINFYNYDELFQTLTLYTHSALLRLKYDTKSRNPLYSKLQYKFPLGYELANIASEVVFQYTNKHLSSGELGFFSIIFNTALNKGISTKKQVLLICGLGEEATKLVVWQLNERFANQIEIIKTTQFYKLNKEDLTNYDFIISTFPIHQELPIPYINIAPIVEEENLNMIENYLSYTYNRHGVETCFHPKLFINNVKVKTKRGVINELHRVIKIQYPTLTDSFKSYVFKEEKTITYECNNLITVLKSSKPINNNNVITVLLLNDFIVWNKQRTKMIILLSLKYKSDYTYNSIIDTIIKLSNNLDDINFIFSHPTYNNFIKTLKKHE